MGEELEMESGHTKSVDLNKQRSDEGEIELLSEASIEIVSHKPSLLIQWANAFFLLVLIGILVACWFIKYPDLIQASAKLTSLNAPKPVVAFATGKLANLYVTEGQIIRKDQVIGYIESTADYNEILKLSSETDSLQMLLSIRPEQIHIYFGNSFTHLGELQPYYQIFSQSYFSYTNYLKNGFYERKITMLKKDYNNLEQVYYNLTLQKSLQDQDLELSQETFDAILTLKTNNVISDFDFRLEQSKLLAKKMASIQLNSNLLNNQYLQNEKKKEIMELENTIEQQRSIFQQAMYTFKSHLDEWKKKYLLVSPVEGKVAFSSFFQENQQLQANQTICYVHPQNTEYFVEIMIPQNNFGKVSTGQTVLLKFPSYPFQEFGSVCGRIESISQIPTESGYSAKVSLPQGLNTSNNKQILYREGLLANAEIVTKSTHLLERFYFNLIKQLR
jgi:HlyD family secretion protein